MKNNENTSNESLQYYLDEENKRFASEKAIKLMGLDNILDGINDLAESLNDEEPETIIIDSLSMLNEKTK